MNIKSKSCSPSKKVILDLFNLLYIAILLCNKLFFFNLSFSLFVSLLSEGALSIFSSIIISSHSGPFIKSSKLILSSETLVFTNKESWTNLSSIFIVPFAIINSLDNFSKKLLFLSLFSVSFLFFSKSLALINSSLLRISLSAKLSKDSNLLIILMFFFSLLVCGWVFVWGFSKFDFLFESIFFCVLFIPFLLSFSDVILFSSFLILIGVLLFFLLDCLLYKVLLNSSLSFVVIKGDTVLLWISSRFLSVFEKLLLLLIFFLFLDFGFIVANLLLVIWSLSINGLYFSFEFALFVFIVFFWIFGFLIILLPSFCKVIFIFLVILFALLSNFWRFAYICLRTLLERFSKFNIKFWLVFDISIIFFVSIEFLFSSLEIFWSNNFFKRLFKISFLFISLFSTFFIKFGFIKIWNNKK